MKYKYFINVILTILIISITAVVLDKLFPLNLTTLQNQSIVLLDRNNEILSIQLAEDQRYRLPVQLSNVDPLFVHLLISYEDKRFYWHPGIDPCALIRAFAQALIHGRIVSGGSTLTMQVARLLEKRPRCFYSKFIEILRAVQLECHFSKAEILEMYLILAPYGGNVEGIRAATLSLFSKEPAQLRPSEAALLAVLPQSPTRLRPHVFPKRAKQFRDKLIDRMVNLNIFTEKQGSEAKEDPIPESKQAFPKHALHVLSEWSKLNKNRHVSWNIIQPHLSVVTTLDKPLQKSIEIRIKSELSFLEPTQTIAALIIENKTHEIRSYVGSADFLDERRHGQINMITAIRSPGSTLKPFIYGFGFDDRIIHPETLIQDVPTGFSEYAPNNFNDVFHGEVTVRQALQQSLNVPAVTVLEKIGPGRWVDWLENVGVKLKFKDGSVKPALPIALGGVGIQLWDLASLYVALANEGEYKNLTLFKRAENKSSNFSKFKESGININANTDHMFSKEAAWHITQILQHTHAPDGFLDNQFSQAPAFAYKTGTSYGYRDAWAIGYTPEYTLAVWVGKPDGTPAINQTGRNTAAPILFKLLSLLPHSSKLGWGPVPEGKLGLSLKVHELPQHLARLSRKKESDKTGIILDENALSIQFPKEGAVLFLEKVVNNNNVNNIQSGFRSVHFILKGGKPPYYGFINGDPLPQASMKSQFIWKPNQVGFVEFSVVDSQGNGAVVNVELRE